MQPAGPANWRVGAGKRRAEEANRVANWRVGAGKRRAEEANRVTENRKELSVGGNGKM